MQTEKFVNFINRAHSAYHAVDALRQQLEQAGYTPLDEGKAWGLTLGGKY